MACGWRGQAGCDFVNCGASLTTTTSYPPVIGSRRPRQLQSLRSLGLDDVGIRRVQGEGHEAGGVPPGPATSGVVSTPRARAWRY